MRINEIFYSLQGEGFHTGTPSVFVRFSGCNLRCPFCDTDHAAGRELTEANIVRAVCARPARHVVLTGGEPSLFVTPALVEALHECGKFVAVETNGTHALPPGIDWVTCSPKTGLTAGAELRIEECDELKVVYTGRSLADYDGLRTRHRFLQPCDTGDPQENRRLLDEAVAYCLAHPAWRLSLQTHKLIGVR